MWVIYKHTNKINGKVYIGQTKTWNPHKRWQSGVAYIREGKYLTKFAKAIIKYGWINFSHEIIEQDISSQEEADIREKYWIKYYDATNNLYGYNSTDGGMGNHKNNDPKWGTKKAVYQIDPKNMQIVNEYESLLAASSAMGVEIVPTKIAYSKGFYWCHKDNWSPTWVPYYKTRIAYVQAVYSDGKYCSCQVWPTCNDLVKEFHVDSRTLKDKANTYESYRDYYWFTLERWVELISKGEAVYGQK